MPRLSCWFIRASLLHLALGVSFGGLILSAKGLPGVLGWSWVLLASHIQILVGGWLVQLTLGMAYWILPRIDNGKERGRPYAAVFSFVALNSGVVGVALLLPMRRFSGQVWFDLLLVLAALLQVGAVGAFLYHAWPRVRPTLKPVVGSR